MPKKQEVANAENTEESHNEGRPSAAPHLMAAAAFGGRHHVVIHYVVPQYFQHWPLLVFLALATYYIFSIGHLLYFQHWPPIILMAASFISFPV